MKVTLILGPVIALFLMAGCGELFDSDDSADQTSQTFEARRTGRWMAPQNLIQKASRYNIGYVGAGPWRGTSGCGGSFSQGAKYLKTWVQDAYPQVTTVGGYNCRRIRGGSGMSVHATGRAIDIHFPLDRGQADNGLGDPVANYLLEHAVEMGVQLIIWDRTIWSSSRSPSRRFREYTGQHPHHDHIHMELTPEAAKKRTPWFSNPAPTSTISCSQVLPPSGGTLDNKSNCFNLHGEERFWRSENRGFSGNLRWTNAFTSSKPSNWAQWNLNFKSAGKYKISYYSVPGFAQFDSTRYEINHGPSKSEIFVDQSAGGSEGWKELGTFDFKAGESQWVAVFDNSLGSVGTNKRIMADAIRVEPVQVTSKPTLGGCGRVYKGGGTIDNKSDCFETFGESKYWRKESRGYGGSLLWTNAFQSNHPSNSAKWNINLEEGGTYEVFYYSVPRFAKFDSTHYEIRHSGAQSDVFVDQSAAGSAGWKSLGSFDFKPGQDQWVSIFDNSPGRVSYNQSIVVDAIRLLPIEVSLSVTPADEKEDIDGDIYDPSQDLVGESSHTESSIGENAQDKTFEDESGPDRVIVAKGCSTSVNSSPNSMLFFSFGILAMFGFPRRSKKRKDVRK